MFYNEFVATGTVKSFDDPGPKRGATLVLDMTSMRMDDPPLQFDSREGSTIEEVFHLGGWAKELARNLLPGQKVNVRAVKEPVVNLDKLTITRINAVYGLDVVEDCDAGQVTPGAPALSC